MQTHDQKLIARKTAIDRERARIMRELVQPLKDEAKAINLQLRAQTIRKNILVRLRSNERPKRHELATLVRCSDEELDALEQAARDSIAGAKAKNPAWRPRNPTRAGKWTLTQLVHRFRVTGEC